MNDSKKISRCQITGSIYLIYCNVTEKFYVGQTIQKVSSRISQHKHGDQYIDKEIQKIGWEGNFDYFILEENIPIENLNALEKFWIKIFDCVYPNGYNITRGGQDHFEVSELTREKLRKSASRKRKPFTAEHKANLSKAMRGKSSSEETRAKKSATAKAKGIRPPVMCGEKNPNYGKDFSPEHRAKLSAAKKGKAPWNKGKKCPQTSATMTGKPCAEETKIKIRVTLIKKDIIKKILTALIEFLSQ